MRKRGIKRMMSGPFLRIVRTALYYIIWPKQPYVRPRHISRRVWRRSPTVSRPQGDQRRVASLFVGLCYIRGCDCFNINENIERWRPINIGFTLKSEAEVLSHPVDSHDSGLIP